MNDKVDERKEVALVMVDKNKRSPALKALRSLALASLVGSLFVLANTDDTVDDRSDDDPLCTELANNGHLLLVVLLLNPLVALYVDDSAHSVAVQAVFLELDAVLEGDGGLAEGGDRSQRVRIIGCLRDDVLGGGTSGRQTGEVADANLGEELIKVLTAREDVLARELKWRDGWDGWAV